MVDPHPESTPDRLRRVLHSSATALELDPADPPTVMRRSIVRRRRRIALAAGFAAVTVAVVGAVVANRDQGDDTLELASPPATTVAAAPDDDAVGTPTIAPTPTPVITTPPTLAPVSNDGGAFDASEAITSSPVGDNAQLLPWRDGFLRIGVEHHSQALPTLTEDIAALFPDEVQALFAEGLPPTINEATEVLDQAGLLDEVTAVLAEHPEAADAIYSVAPEPPTVSASFTVDGAEWRTVDLPSSMSYAQFTVAGERLIMWSTEFTDEDLLDGDRTFTLSWTEDLATWQTESIDLDARRDADGVVESEAYVESVAVVGDRWVAQISVSTWVEYERLLPEEARGLVDEGEYGVHAGDVGITVEGTDSEGEDAVFEYTWAELGLEGPPLVDRPGGADAELAVGVFGEGFEMMPSPLGGYAQVLTGGDEFLLIGDDNLSSPDGMTWTPLTGFRSDQHIQSVVAVDDGDLFIGTVDGEPAAWLRDSSGNLLEAVLPELPDPYVLWETAVSGAWIVPVGDQGLDEWVPITVTLDYGGYTLTMTDGPDGTDYTLVDSVTGDVVRQQSFGFDSETTPWQAFDEATGDAVLVIEDEAGTELVRIPRAVVAEAYQPPGTVDGSLDVTDEWSPDLWLIATRDGLNWLTVDLAEPSPELAGWLVAAAVNNGSVLYETVDGWVLESLP